jgi:hypothetical protein
MRRRRSRIMILSSISVSDPAIDSNLDQYYDRCIIKFMEKEVIMERKILYYSSANLKLGWWLTQINLVVRGVDQTGDSIRVILRHRILVGFLANTSLHFVSGKVAHPETQDPLEAQP